jgi:hypothetical protein
MFGGAARHVQHHNGTTGVKFIANFWTAGDVRNMLMIHVVGLNIRRCGDKWY